MLSSFLAMPTTGWPFASSRNRLSLMLKWLDLSLHARRLQGGSWQRASTPACVHDGQRGGAPRLQGATARCGGGPARGAGGAAEELLGAAPLRQSPAPETPEPAGIRA